MHVKATCKVLADAEPWYQFYFRHTSHTIHAAEQPIAARQARVLSSRKVKGANTSPVSMGKL